MAIPPSAKVAADQYAELFPDVYLKFHRRDAKRGELSGASRGVLLHLAQSGPLTVGDCARHLKRTQSVISEIVEQLVRHGWLAKVRDDNDRRRTVVWLTELGRDRLVEDQSVLARGLLEGALDRMMPEQRRMLIEGTQALVRAAAALELIPKDNTRRRHNG